MYAYTNFDIDPLSFVAQEFTIAGFCLLVAAVWLKWCGIAAHHGRFGKVENPESYLNSRLVSDIQHAFYRWIIGSIVLGLGFTYFTTFFWSLVAQDHDERYILSAFLAHTLWVFTWAFISTPLLTTWSLLKSRRLIAIEELMKSDNSTPGTGEHLSLAELEKVESLAGVRISIAGIGAVISLVLPILQLFIHRN